MTPAVSENDFRTTGRRVGQVKSFSIVRKNARGRGNGIDPSTLADQRKVHGLRVLALLFSRMNFYVYI